MDILRNLPVQQPAALRELISIQPGRVVSMALSRSEHCQMTLLALGTERASVRSATSATRSIMCWRVICLCAWRGTRSAWAQGIVWLSRRRPPTPLAGAALQTAANYHPIKLRRICMEPLIKTCPMHGPFP